MQSRMDKYGTYEEKKYERSKKNTKLYEKVYDDMYRDTTYQNMEVIDSAKEININKLKNMLDDKYDTRQYRTLRNYDIEDINIDDKPVFNTKRQRVHDINEIINEAKSKRAFIEEAKEKQKYIDFSKRSSKYNEYDKMKDEEEELEDLINTMAIKNDDEKDISDALDMFSDLKGSDNTIVSKPINTSFDLEGKTEDVYRTKTDDIKNDLEKTLIKADKTFYTDSNMFTKNDFEDFSTLTNQLKRKRKTKIFIIILLVLIILGVISYFVATKLIIK